MVDGEAFEHEGVSEWGVREGALYLYSARAVNNTGSKVIACYAAGMWAYAEECEGAA